MVRGEIKRRGKINKVKPKTISKKVTKKIPKKVKTNLYFSNRKEYTRRKNISKSLKNSYARRIKRMKVVKTRQKQIQESKFYRYSIAYYNSVYNKTFRAEV